MRKLLIEAVEQMTPKERESWEINFERGNYRNEAGTDHPFYVDFKNNVVISGDYEDDDARPFAYFPVDLTEEPEFFIKEFGLVDDEIVTHGDLFGEAFYQYVYNFIWRKFADKEIAFVKKMKEFGDIVKEGNLNYNRWNRTFENIETGKEINFMDFLTNLFSELGILVEVSPQMSHLYAEFFNEYNWETHDFIEDITSFINDSELSYYDTSDQELIALEVGIGDLDNVLYKSKFEGRIWDEGRLITFYPGQQPSRHELPEILKDICRDGGHTMEELGNFYIIFETGSKEAYTGTGYKRHKDATVKCCLVKDYLQGNYEGYDAKAEADMVKNRKGINNFCAHLANQKEKFNYFKAFRSNRDRAVYAPREKGAGTLAGYHAMRYPYGEEKEVNGNELNESLAEERNYNEAGTDHPYYRNKYNGEVVEANWNDGDGFPFGYWPVDADGTLEFCVGDYGETHAQACGIAAKKYFDELVNDYAYNAADGICYALNNFFEEFNDGGYKYNEKEDAYISADGSSKLDEEDCIDRVLENIYDEFGDTYTVVSEFVEQFLKDGVVPSFDDVQEKLLEDIDSYSFYKRDDIDNALELVGTNFSDFFEEGRHEGRIWPDKELITFYDTQQPSPEEMEEIIYDLGEYMDEPYEYFMNFRYIYEDWDDDDYLIKMCTIDNFINSDVEEPDKQYAKDGKTVFVPHLANQQDKFNFFKNFRNTRDRAVFAPREKAAGTLAGYHAMRYPFGESRKSKLLALVNEEINKMINESKNSNRAKNQTISIIANKIGLDVDSPYVIDMEHKFKTMFFHHGLDNDRYIVFEPNLCRCALDLGFGTNDFTGEDMDYISNVFDLIYRYVEKISDAPTRQSELKRIKDNITSFEGLKVIANELQGNNVGAENSQEQEEDNKERITQLQNGYTVIGPIDYNTANEYGQYSNPKGRICFTYQSSQWDSYSKKGVNTCYVLLRNGWKNIQPEHDGSEKNCILGAPFNEKDGYDNYGTSMIFIFVNPQGNLVHANGRWNHGAHWPDGYRCDNEYTEDDISRLIGVPFRKVFKSAYNFNEILAKAIERLKNGEILANVFDASLPCKVSKNNEYGAIVRLAGMENVLFKGKFLSPVWFDRVITFNKMGLACGKIGDTNYIFDANGKRYKFSEISQIINNRLMNGEHPKEIFDDCRLTNGNLYVVGMFDKRNAISLKTNKLISNIWFDVITTVGGLISGKINDKKYFLFEDGKIVSEEKTLARVLDNIENYPKLSRHEFDVNDETFCVHVLDNYYYIRKSDKKPVNAKGFTRVERQSNSRFVWVYNNSSEKYSLDLKTGNLIPENEFYTYLWNLSGLNSNGFEENYFQEIEPAGEGIYRVFFGGKGWNYVKDGSLMFYTWFKDCSGFKNGLAKVLDNSYYGWRIINTNGEFLTKEGFENLDIYGKYAIGFDDEENDDFNGDNDEYLTYFTVIDLSTGEEICKHVRLYDEVVLNHTTLGNLFVTDDDENFIVFTKDGQMLDEDDYAKLLSETYKRTKDLSLFNEIKGMDYGYRKVKAAWYSYNILDKEENLVLNEWAFGLTDFSDGRLKIQGENYFNFLDENLRPILPNNNPYTYGNEFCCGFARVFNKTTNRYYFIDVNGNIAFDKNGYEFCTNFTPHSRQAEVKIGGKYYYLSVDGSLKEHHY